MLFQELFSDYLREDADLIHMLSAQRKDDNLEIKITAPGYNKNELQLDIEGNNILIRTEDTGKAFHLDSLSYVDVSDTKASLDKGILELKIPLKNQNKIEIK